MRSYTWIYRRTNSLRAQYSLYFSLLAGNRNRRKVRREFDLFHTFQSKIVIIGDWPECGEKTELRMAGGDNVKSRRITRVLVSFGFIVVMATMNACVSNETPEQRKAREDKIRDDAAKAIERAKPEIQAAGRQLGQVADDAAREARAFAEGVRQGWIRGGHHIVNLNSASISELTELPDISAPTARKIVRNRPYHDTSELVTKHIVSESEYSKIKDIVAVQ